MAKNPPANAGDVRDLRPIPGLGRSPEKEMATHSSILVWRIPWTREHGYSTWDRRESDTTERLIDAHDRDAVRIFRDARRKT